MLACPFGIHSEREYNGYYSDIIKVTKKYKKMAKNNKSCDAGGSVKGSTSDDYNT